MKGFIILLCVVAMVTSYRYDYDIMRDMDDEMSKRGLAVPVGDIQQEALLAHNEAREKHVDTLPLKWSSQLANDALSYALELANSGRFQHSTAAKYYGENLYRGADYYGVTPFKMAAYFWYQEINDYKYENSKLYSAIGPGGIGHFTQMVWTTSTEVGCAGAKLSGKKVTTVYVCRYSPPGNIPSYYGECVKPLTSSAPSSCEDKNPSFCADITASQCAEASLSQWLIKNCAKKCNAC